MFMKHSFNLLACFLSTAYLCGMFCYSYLTWLYFYFTWPFSVDVQETWHYVQPKYGLLSGKVIERRIYLYRSCYWTSPMNFFTKLCFNWVNSQCWCRRKDLTLIIPVQVVTEVFSPCTLFFNNYVILLIEVSHWFEVRCHAYSLSCRYMPEMKWKSWFNVWKWRTGKEKTTTIKKSLGGAAG